MAVSFLVTVFNKRPFLPRVLASVEAEREVVGGEALVIDDGSTDGSGAWLEQFAEGRSGLRVLRGANAGVAAATNRAFALCSGEFVRLVDGDDPLVPGSTAALRAALASRPAAVVAFGAAGAWELADPEPPALAPDVSVELVPDPLRAALRSQLFTPSALLARRDALARCLPLDEAMRTCHDLVLSLRLARLGAFLRLRAEVCVLAGTAAGRLSADRARMYADSVRVIEAHWDGWSSRDRRYALHRAALRAALYTRRHRRDPGRAAALHAVALLAPVLPPGRLLGWVRRAYAAPPRLSAAC